MGVSDEFRVGIAGFAERVAKYKDVITNEEATKIALVLPFLGLLGYDCQDPSEVAPEFPADFSDKYKNRVDYAVLQGGLPVIAVECKSLGNSKKDDRGQLKAYFNAAKSVTLGILTDGVCFEFYVDYGAPNLMDDEPYLVVDFQANPKGLFADRILESLADISKPNFDPGSIADNAHRNIIHRAVYDYLNAQFQEPCDDFTRFVLKQKGVKYIKNSAMESYRVIARAAFRDVFNDHILRRLDIDAATLPPAKPAPQPAPAPAATPAPVDPHGEDHGIETTAAEIEAFDRIRRLLAFRSAGDAAVFAAIEDVHFRDYKGKMGVFYRFEKKGRLVDIFEGKDGTVRFAVIDGGDATPTADLAGLADRLQALFAKRIAELA